MGAASEAALAKDFFARIEENGKRIRWQKPARHGGFNNRSRRREEADFCNKSSSASSRRRLQRSGRFLNPALRCPAEGRFALTLTMGRIASPLDDNTDAHQPIQAHAQSFPPANWSLEQPLQQFERGGHCRGWVRLDTRGYGTRSERTAIGSEPAPGAGLPH